MLRKLNLNQRFGLLILVPVLMVLLVNGFNGWNTLASSWDINALQQQQQRQQPLQPLADLIGTELTTIAYSVALGQMGWQSALEQLTGLHDRFESQWQRYLGSLPPADRTALENRYRSPLVELRRAFSELSHLLESRDRAQLRLLVINELDALIQPYLNTLHHQFSQQRAETVAHYQALHNAQQRRTWISWGLAVLGIGVVVAVGWIVRQSIMQPVGRIASVARSVTIGDYSVRVGFSGRDELGKLGQALDRVLDDQQEQVAQSKEERSRLQQSIGILLQHFKPLEQGDLNTRLPTDDEITQTLALSINRMVERLATTWAPLSQLAEQIGQHGQALRNRADQLVASNHPSLIQELSESSGRIETTLQQTLKLSQACYTVALDAQRSTEATLQALQPLATTEPAVRPEHILQPSLETLQNQTTALQAVVTDFAAVAAQAHLLAITADLQHSADGYDASLVNDLKNLARSLKRAQELLIPLGERIHGEADRLLQSVRESAEYTQSSAPLLENSYHNAQRSHTAVGKLTETISKLNADLNHQGHDGEQRLVYNAELNTQAEQLQQALQEQASQSATLNQRIEQLQQLAPSSKAPSPSEQPSDSHAPLSMKP